MYSKAQNITTDDRSWLMYRLMSMDVNATYAYFYPRVIPVVSKFYAQN